MWKRSGDLAGRRRAGGRRRRAYLLIMVLGITMMVSTLGLAYLESNATAMPEALNRAAAAKAKYLAESGVDVATHFLLYPPSGLGVGECFQGVSNVSADGSADVFSVSVSQEDRSKPVYMIEATGVGHDLDGEIAGKHTVRVEALLPDPPLWKIPYAYLGTGNTTLQDSCAILGDVHVNGWLIGYAWCHDVLSATGFLLWLGDGHPAATIAGAASVATPPLDASQWSSYVMYGRRYEATQLNVSELSSGIVEELNNMDLSATNPGRVFIAPSGDVRLGNWAKLNGTLVVNHYLRVHRGSAIRAEPLFPALVVRGNILCEGNFYESNPPVTIEGSVLCGGWISTESKKDAKIDILGACIARDGLEVMDRSASITVTWDADRAKFLKFEPPLDRAPVTILSWDEN